MKIICLILGHDYSSKDANGIRCCSRCKKQLEKTMIVERRDMVVILKGKDFNPGEMPTIKLSKDI